MVKESQLQSPEERKHWIYVVVVASDDFISFRVILLTGPVERYAPVPALLDADHVIANVPPVLLKLRQSSGMNF